jgi:hypothetical protein
MKVRLFRSGWKEEIMRMISEGPLARISGIVYGEMVLEYYGELVRGIP